MYAGPDIKKPPRAIPEAEKKEMRIFYRLCNFTSETLTRLRPLRRRALRTLRPLAVAMRERKPCLFLRFLFEG